MPTHRLALVAAACTLALALADAPTTPKLPPPATQTVDFARDIEPILKTSCIQCHGPEKQRGGLRLDHGPSALQGGNSGAVIRPRKSGDSRLIHLVAGLEADSVMPPGKNKQLTPAQIGLLRAWIDQGAVFPTTGPAAATRSTHWAFQPVRRPAVPMVQNQGWLRSAIDAFILSRLERERITPSPEADRVTLMRRLYFDLIGLPPTPAEVDAFLADTQPGAYERLVERLLASPHYGERWARHWLDVARYADSDGFEKDTGRPFAWRYRHWLILALNGDLPYNWFLIHQLAGDLLPNATVETRVATGFHRNTLTNKEGGADQEQFRVEAVVDRVNTTMKAFQGLTMGCAQCHDHKYDPLTQREYYQLFAFFNSDVEKNIPAPVVGFESAGSISPAQQKKLGTLIQQEKTYKQKQLPANLAAWEKSLTAAQRQTLPAATRAILDVPPANRSEKQKIALTTDYASRDKDLVKLQQQITQLQKLPATTQAQTMALGKGRKTHVMIRGDFLRSGVEVSAGVPAVLSPKPARTQSRLDLANWLASTDNPLTARVAVNWTWHKFFGRGIVPTLEDFGTQGEPPSHPELLDWLADEFVQQGWSLKQLHRLIVTSAAYRQSSHVRPELAARDPYNVLVARQVRQRLEGEVIRDVCLAASGKLVPIVGGPSTRPPQPTGISELTYANSARWIESTGNDRYRRGLYTWFQRTSPYPMLMTFDAPDGNLSCVRREKSNTPLQALTLLNDSVFVDCAQGLARRVLAESTDTVDDRLRYAFRLCTARVPTRNEATRLRRLYDELAQLVAADETGARQLVGQSAGANVVELATWTAVARALLNLDEMVMRE